MCPYYEWDSKKEKFVKSLKPSQKKKPQVLYRLAKDSDKDVILDFAIECHRAEPEVFLSVPNFDERRRELQSISFDKAKDFAVVLALADNKVVGELSVSWYFNYDENCKVGVIPGLWVLRSYRMVGVGRGLVDFAKGVFKELGAKRIELVVGLENFAAQAFYKKLGLKVITEGLAILDLECNKTS